MKSRVYTVILALLTVAIGAWGYFNLPETVPMHWNWQGEIDGYGSKYSVIFGVPLIAVVLYVLRTITPKIDPRKENYTKFRGSYDTMIHAILTFFVIMYGMIILNGAGYEVPIDFVMPLLIGILFIIVGNYTQRVKSNYFIGIRTPWALQNDEIWRYTNRLGAKMFVLAGILMIIAAFLPTMWKISLFIVAVISTAGVPFVASYLYYKKLSN